MEALLRLPRVIERTGCSRSTLLRLIAADEFPHPVKLGARSIAWPASEVDAWVRARILSGRKGMAKGAQ